LSSFFAPFAPRRAHFYNFAARNTPKVQIVFAPCRNIAVYTKRRANRVFHLLKTLWKVLKICFTMGFSTISTKFSTITVEKFST